MDETEQTVPPDFKERRGSERLIHCGTVRVGHPSFVEKLLQLRGFSENGTFLFCDWTDMPPLGSLIELQGQELSETAPWVKAKLVRFCEKGAGLSFCDE